MALTEPARTAAAMSNAVVGVLPDDAPDDVVVGVADTINRPDR
jgi:hypothetical protein